MIFCKHVYRYMKPLPWYADEYRFRGTQMSTGPGTGMCGFAVIVRK